MGIKRITVYYNTGFDGMNIPGNPDILATANSKVYEEFYFMRESVDLPVVRIRDSYDNLADVDYVKIHDTVKNLDTYYFAVPHAESKNTTSLGLVLDALLTMGGAENLNYSSGWIERGHIAKSEDTLFSNVAPEDFQPSRPLMIDQWQEIKPTPTTAAPPFNIIISNVDLPSLAGSNANICEAIQGIVTGATEPSVFFPRVPTSVASSEFIVEDPGGNEHSFKLPNTGAYDGNNTGIMSAISKLHSMGQLQLVASYSIPSEWLSYWDLDGNGVFQELKGISEQQILISRPYDYDNTIKNKKCFAMFRTASLLSLASGDRTTANIYDTYKTEEYPTVDIWSDPSSTGKPFASFTNLNAGIAGSGILHPYARAVRGAQWNTAQLVLEGASGSAWNTLSAAFQKSQLSMGYEQTLIDNNMTQGSLAERIAIQKEQNRIWDTRRMLGNVNAAAGMIDAVTAKEPSVSGVIGGATNIAERFITYKADAMQNRLELNELARQNEALAASQELQRRQYMQSRNEAGFAELKGNTAAPSVSFTPEINLGLYGYNYFAYYETRLNPLDLAELDAYFQRFGYNGIHKPLTAAALKTRQFYNFVQATGVSIKSPRGMRIRERGVEQLNGGVRIWHVLPDRSYFDTN